MKSVPLCETLHRIERGNGVDVNLDDGPVDLLVGNRYPLRIVDPLRDLTVDASFGISPSVDILLIAPEDFSPVDSRGYKAIWPGEEVMIGRDHTHESRFSFDEFTSARQFKIMRNGRELRITDEHSSNGTYIGQRALSGAVKYNANPPGEIAELRNPETSALSIGAASLKAEYHLLNEDHHFVDLTNWSAGVLDGVGSHAGSERASEVGSQAAKEYLRRSGNTMPVNQGIQTVRAALVAADAAILREAKGAGIATTGTIFKIFTDERGLDYVPFANLGDGRAYLVRDRELSVLTLDDAAFRDADLEEARILQDVLAEAVSDSDLDDLQRIAFKFRYKVSCILGHGYESQIATTHIMLRAGDRIVLTTDGVHDNLTTSEIKNLILANNDDDQAANVLVNASSARSKASHFRSKPDDMTAVVMSYLRS